MTALTLTSRVRNDEEEWLRTARRVLVNRPQVVGLISVGEPVDTGAVARELALAISRLSGQAVGLFPSWRLWPDTAGVSEVLSSDTAQVVVLSPPTEIDAGGELDVLVALSSLDAAVAHARRSFPHLVVDLGGLPLRHPATLACADAIVTVVASGGVRAEHLLAVERLLPGPQNLGVMLIDE
jgi:hypothetical protein